MGVDNLDTGTINIERITIEKPKKDQDSVFDPEKDIPKNIWDEVEHELKNTDFDIRGQNYLMLSPSQWLTLAYSTKTLSPERFEKLQLDDSCWEVIKKDFSRYRQWGFLKQNRKLSTRELDDLSCLLEKAKFLAPEKFNQLYKSQKDYYSDFGEIMTNIVTDIGQDKIISSGLVTLRDGKYSDYIDQDMLYKTGLKALNNRRPYQTDHGDWETFSWMAAELRLMFPERFKEMGIKPIDFEGIKNDYHEKVKMHKLIDTIDIARSIYILEADEVIVGEKGFKIIPKKEIEKPLSTTPIPEERNY